MKTNLLEKQELCHSISRKGVIIKCPQNGLFQDACDVILTSRMAIREMVDPNPDQEWPMTLQKDPFYQHFLEKSRLLTNCH